jgi:hypothetical protein
MSARDDGGPAFPIQGSYDTDYEHNGMTLRDWFAGQALAGILGGGFADTIPHDDLNGGRDAAAFAYQYADAMIAARKGGAA